MVIQDERRNRKCLSIQLIVGVLCCTIAVATVCCTLPISLHYTYDAMDSLALLYINGTTSQAASAIESMTSELTKAVDGWEDVLRNENITYSDYTDANAPQLAKTWTHIIQQNHVISHWRLTFTCMCFPNSVYMEVYPAYYRGVVGGLVIPVAQGKFNNYDYDDSLGGPQPVYQITYNCSTRKWVTGPLSKRSGMQWSTGFNVNPTITVTLAFSRNMYDTSGRYIGAGDASYNLEQLVGFVAGIQRTPNSLVLLYMYHDTSILATTALEYPSIVKLNTTSNTDLVERFGAGQCATKSDYSFCQHNMTNYPLRIVRDFWNNFKGNPYSGANVMYLDGSSYYTGQQVVLLDDLKLMVVILMPSSDIDGPVTTGKNNSIISAVCAAVGIVLIAVVCVKLSLSPLTTLGEDMEELAMMRTENVTAAAESSFLEVARLQSSFNIMQRNLKEYRNYIPAAVISLANDEGEVQEEELVSKSSRGSSSEDEIDLDKKRALRRVQSAAFVLVIIEKQCTYLVFNKKGWNEFVESVEPERVRDAMTEYLTAVLEATEKHRGVADTFMGDRYTASWGAVITCGTHIQNACKCSLEVCRALSGVVQVGVVSGYMYCGNLGCDKLRRFTITGPQVSFMYALQALNKKYNTTILTNKWCFSGVWRSSCIERWNQC